VRLVVDVNWMEEREKKVGRHVMCCWMPLGRLSGGRLRVYDSVHAHLKVGNSLNELI
jgi:hypothetical protein